VQNLSEQQQQQQHQQQQQQQLLAHQRNSSLRGRHPSNPSLAASAEDERQYQNLQLYQQQQQVYRVLPSFLSHFYHRLCHFNS